MAVPESDRELIEQLKELTNTLNKPKKETSNWIGILMSFLSTVVIAGLSLYFSNLQAERSYTINVKQLDLQRANQKLEQLKLVNELIPQLAGKDTALRAKMTLKLLEISAKTEDDKITAVSLEAGKKESLITHTRGEKNGKADNLLVSEFFSQVKLLNSNDQPISVRQSALAYIGTVASSPKTPENIRQTAVELATDISKSTTEPKALRATADEILRNIKNVTVTQLKDIISGEQVSRKVDGIIIHHVGQPLSVASYRGVESVKILAKIQMEGFRWNRVSWHYLIVPDGTIWLGVPLGMAAIHAARLNPTTVSVCLYIDGDKELPTEAQKISLRQIITMINAKVKLDNSAVHTHSFLDPGKKTCPGKYITEAYIQQLL